MILLLHRTFYQLSQKDMSNESFMIEELVKELVLKLMEEHKMSMKEALDTVYNSDTYGKVLDLETGLFSQSTAYVYSILERELKVGRIVADGKIGG